MEETQAESTYENKVFYNVEGYTGDYKYAPKSGTIFKNCIFYNSSVRTDSNKYPQDTTITFENCSFIGAPSEDNAPIEVYDNTTSNLTVVIKNCTFTQTKRGINIVGSNAKDGKTTVKIDGCTFNGTTNDKFAAIQIAEPAVYVEFINNTVNALGNAPAVVRYHETFFTMLQTDTNYVEALQHFTFSGNKVSSSIPESKYIDLDQHKNDGFYTAALESFKKGVK